MARAFGRVLRAARVARGLSQEELAAEAELSRTYPSLLERGLREPTLSVLIRLADALHCPPTALVEATLAQLPAAYARQWLGPAGGSAAHGSSPDARTRVTAAAQPPPARRAA